MKNENNQTNSVNVDTEKVSSTLQKGFPEDIQFKYKWRKYQQRVLDELDTHLTDNHLHVIAPPGSGKTVLGLEVALRLDKPTLILAPTLAIQNQWIQRFCELFLQVDRRPNWISSSIKSPKFLTVTTYQSLYAFCTEDKLTGQGKKVNVENAVTLLKEQGVGTVVIDEAHHLKNAWWKVLIEVKKQLSPTVVGLTATPPYDVSALEWYRYIELNGAIDTEITVPELVVEGDLCPHQDYVFFSAPTPSEQQVLDDFKERSSALFQSVVSDKTFISILQEHPVFASSVKQKHTEWIYANMEFYSSILIFLNAVKVEISEHHLSIVGSKDFQLPELNVYWMEKLLSFYLYNNSGFKEPEEGEESEESIKESRDILSHQESLENKLKRGGVIDRKTINFTQNKKTNTTLHSSTSKLESVLQIIDFEYKSLGQDLRMVVLTDYIRKEYLSNNDKNELKLDKLGVLSIFEKLRREGKEHIKVGILSGSLVVIPQSAKPFFDQEIEKYQDATIVAKPLPYDKNYLIINVSEKYKNNIVHTVTQVFQQGGIEVLIGTTALLGEGWDAPAVNSLVLASFVGSYVLSNQMRGRAIRSSNEIANKTGNIWHLACIDPNVSQGGDDVKLLKRRFKSFVGVSVADKEIIENGTKRLGLPDYLSIDAIEKLNAQMFLYAGKRDELKQRWDNALVVGTKMVREVKVPFTPKAKEKGDYEEIKELYYKKTVKYFVGSFATIVATVASRVWNVLEEVFEFVNREQSAYILSIMALCFILYFGRSAWRSLRMYVQYRDIAKDFHQIGIALLKTLTTFEQIKTSIDKLTVVSNIDKKGAIYCHLAGATTEEQSVFVKALQEVISLVGNPRYILIRRSKLFNIVEQKDYHAVPEMLGKKKDMAYYLLKQWRINVGEGDLVYAWSIQGRKALLKARVDSLASEFQGKSERLDVWR